MTNMEQDTNTLMITLGEVAAVLFCCLIAGGGLLWFAFEVVLKQDIITSF